MSIEGVANTEYASLSGKIHTMVVDKTLSISGACADAKATGDAIEKLYDISEDAKEAYEEAKAAYDETVATMEEVARDVAEEVSKEEVERKINELDILLPQIIVTAASGSTVTCTKGEVVLTVGEVDGVWTFNLPEYGRWSVIIDGIHIETLMVDTVKQYTVELNSTENYTMLYDAGDECEAITGGWVDGYGGGYANTTVTKGDTSITVTAAQIGDSGTGGVGLSTSDKIPVTNYSLLGAFVSGSSLNEIRLSTTTSIDADYGRISGDNDTLATFSTSTEFCVADISSASAEVYVNVCARGLAASTIKLTMYYSALFKADTWQPLCEFVGATVPDKLATLIADNASITAILTNEAAVAFMVKYCTGDFMARFIESAECLASLEASPYKEVVYANEHWAKFLAMVA